MSRGNLKVAACLAAAAISLTLSVASSVDAPAQPSRNFKIIVPYPPASGPDILSRLMAEQIGKTHGATVVIENRPGGGTMIGTQAAARATPDGGTGLLVANTLVINPALPDVPTFAEAGITPYDADIFYGIVAPTKTPPEALKQLSAWFGAALKASDVQPRLAQQGLFPVGMCGAPFGDFMKRLTEDYARIIRESGMKVE